MKCLKKKFLYPPDEFSPIPFWFLNDILEKDVMKKQLLDFYDKGIRGIVLHPRKGLPDTQRYMSETFLDYIEYIVEEASKLQIKVFLYDEAMYPSGAANGMVVKANPAYAAKGLQMTRVLKGEPLPEFGEGNWFVASVPADDDSMYYFSLVYSEGTIRGVHEGEDDGEPNAPKAADLLDVDAMKLFIQLTHDAYYERLSKYFGSTIVAMFTDEPSILGREPKNGLIPWTHNFLTHYLDCGGKEEHLPMLFEEKNADTQLIYQTYRHALILWIEKSFFAPISNWCTVHGVALSGHPHESNEIGVLKYFHIPCQDVVWRYVDPEKGTGIVGHHSTMGKCTSDSSRHRGRRRNGNECFGACGQKDNPWDFTAADMKWYLDWLFVRGVNLIIPHAFYYSLRDERVNERPPDVGPNSIWWKHYEQITTYIKRMCWLNTDGYNVTDVAVLCTKEHLPWEAMQTMYQHQIEFNYLEAELLSECIFDRGCLQIEKQCYKALVVEDGLFLTEEQKKCLQKLKDAGMVILYIGKSCDGQCLKRLSEYNPLALKTLSYVEDLRVTHVCKEGMHFYFMTNEGDEDLYFWAQTAVKGDRELWNPWDGSMTRVDCNAPIPIKLGYREGLILAVKPAEARDVLLEGGEIIRIESLHSETRRYTADVMIQKEEHYSVAEVNHTGELAALYIDGKKLGIRMWKPYCFNLEGKLTKGIHSISLEITEPMGRKSEKNMPTITLL